MTRRRAHLLWVIPAALVAAAALLVLGTDLLIRAAWFRNWALDRSGIAQALSGTQRWRVDRVDTFSISGIRLTGIRIETRDAQGWSPWLQIGELEAEWVPAALLARRIAVRSVWIDSVSVDLPRMPHPLFAPGSAAAKAGAPAASVSASVPQLPWIRCRSLRIGRVRVRGEGDARYDGTLRLTRLAQDRGALRGTLEEAVLHVRPDTLDLALRGARISGELGREVRVDSLRLISGGIDATLEARWSAGRSAASGPAPSAVAGELTLARLAPYQMPRLRRLSLPWTPGDEVAGRIRFDGFLAGGEPPHGELAAGLSGRLLGQELDSLLVNLAASPDSAELRALRLRCGDLRLEGSVRWRRAGPSASARLRFAGLDLAGGPVRLLHPGLPSTRLAGEAEAEADSLGPRLRLNGRLRLEPGRFHDQAFDGFSARVSLDPGWLSVDSLQTSEPGSPVLRAAGRFRRADRFLEASGTLASFPLETWIAPLIDHVTEGRVSGPFQLHGPVNDLRVEGDLRVRGGRFEEVYVDSLRVDDLNGGFSPLKLRGNVRAGPLNVYKIPLDSLRGWVEVGDTIRTRVTTWHDTTKIGVRVRVIPVSRGAVLIDSIRIRPGSAPLVDLEFPARLDFNPQIVRCDSAGLRSEAGSVAGSGWIIPRHGGTNPEPFGFRLHGEGCDLGAVLRYFRLPAEDLDGRAGFEFEGSGTVENPQYRYRVRVTDGRTYGWRWDAITFAGRAGAAGSDLSGAQVTLDSLRGVSLGYFARPPGLETVEVGPAAAPIELAADSLSLGLRRSWAAAVSALADSSWTLLREAALGGWVRVRELPLAPILTRVLPRRAGGGPRASFAQPIDPMVAAIREVKPGEQAVPEAGPTGIAGTAALGVRLRGTGASPRIDLAMDAAYPRVYQAWADSVVLRASFADSVISLQRLDWYMGATDSHAAGTIPLSLQLGPRLGARLPHRPTRITADVPQIDLSLATLFTSLVQDPGGRVGGTVSLVGIGPRLHAEGDLTVQNGSFRVPAREERFSGIQANLHLDSLGVHILQAKGKLNGAGSVTAWGTYLNDDHFDLHGSVRDGLVYETGNYRFVANADLAARPVADGDSLRPRLSGTVQVQQGLITQDLSKQPAGQTLPPRTPWLVDLDVNAPGNLRANQPGMAVDLGEGNLHVTFRWPYWNMSGTLTVLGGSYRIFNREFTIDSGTIEFQDIGKGPNPVFDVVASSEVTVEGVDGPVEVQVEVKGSPVQQDLQVVMSSPNHPELTDADLMTSLSAGQLGRGGTQAGTARTLATGRQFLGNELLSQMETQLVSQLPLADRVQITGEFGGQQPMRINLRPIVRPQWSVNYAQDLAANPGRQVAVRYRLSNLFFLNSVFDRVPINGLPEDKYSLDLKFRVEY